MSEHLLLQGVTLLSTNITSAFFSLISGKRVPATSARASRWQWDCRSHTGFVARATKAATGVGRSLVFSCLLSLEVPDLFLLFFFEREKTERTVRGWGAAFQGALRTGG